MRETETKRSIGEWQIVLDRQKTGHPWSCLPWISTYVDRQSFQQHIDLVSRNLRCAAQLQNSIWGTDGLFFSTAKAPDITRRTAWLFDPQRTEQHPWQVELELFFLSNAEGVSPQTHKVNGALISDVTDEGIESFQAIPHIHIINGQFSNIFFEGHSSRNTCDFPRDGCEARRKARTTHSSLALIFSPDRARKTGPWISPGRSLDKQRGRTAWP